MKIRLITIFTLSLMVSLFTNSFAATITVDATDGAVADDGLCSISEAIIAANTNAVVSGVTGECNAGDGPDTIILSNNITLTAEYENTAIFGRTGTPVISSTLVLDGQGFTLQRDASLTCDLNLSSEIGEFRILRITGNLTLQSISIAQGCVDGNGGLPPNGGGLLNRGVLSLEQVTIQDNRAGTIGGGLWHGQGRISSISKSLFVNNSADKSGGGGLYSQGPITLIENSTFSGNSASGSGGGILNEASLNSINNSTFSGNSARFGAGYSNGNFGSETNITNSLFHNNDGINECAVGLTVINGSNNISDDTSGGCPGLISPALTTSSVSDTLADNGGPTMTHALLLLPRSEALDNGDANSTLTDQRGLAASGTRDIGAFEYQNPLYACPIALQTDGFTTSVANPTELNQAIECANLNGEANGGDTINLSADITLTTAFDTSSLGSTGTPAITSTIILDGMGFSLVRDANLSCNSDGTNDTNEFRLMLIESSGDISLNNITLSNGCADGSGFGFVAAGGTIFSKGSLSIQNSIFSGNFGRFGGAIYNQGSLSIQSSTFSGNSVFRDGGAIFNEGTITTIQNSTFSGNSASNGGVIFSQSIITTIENTTFSGNTASNDGNGIINNGSINILRNSLFHNNTGIGSECRTFGTINGSNNLSDNAAGLCPGLLATTLTTATVGPLTDNGGPTMTHALLPGSQAIDNGGANSTLTDQRGFAALGIRDIGAFEAQPLDLCPVALQTDGFTASVANPTELNQAIECSDLNGEANGGDTIELSADITLTQEYENDALYGHTGTAPINSKLILDGKGFILQRDATTANLFRLLRTTAIADVSIKNIELVNGKITEAGVNGTGGALFNQAKLQLTNSIIRQNFALSGGGLSHIGTNHSIISNSLFKQNDATYDGSDIRIRNGLLDTIENTTFTESGSTSSIYVSDGNINTINNSTFSTIGGISIYLRDGVINSVNNSSFIGSTTAIQGFDDTTFVFGRVTNLNNNIFKNSSACFELNITNSNNNLADAIITCEGTTVGNAGIATNVSTTLADNSCTIPLADGSCVPTHALMPSSNAIDNSVSGTATDQRGFTASSTRDIGAFETFSPSVIAPNDITSEATGLLTSPSLGLAIVTDMDETGLIATASQSSDFTLGMTTVTWSVTDSQGFTDSDTQVVNIVDTTAPIVNAPIDITIEATNTLTPVNLGTATAVDIVDGALTPTVDNSGPFAVGTTTVTWSATDAENNSGTATQMVTIVDSTAPVLTLTGDDTISLLVGDSYTDAGATATDLVDNDATLTANIVVNNPVNTAAAGTYPITYNVSDNAGNAAMQITRTVNVLAIVSGTVVGLAAGTSVEIQNNKGDNIVINTDGAFTFATALTLNAPYEVTVLNQPVSPTQMCSVSNASGQITSGNISNVVITCTTNQYIIGGMASGLASGNSVILDINSGAEILPINTNGAFVFTNPLTDLSHYTIEVGTQPTSPSQTCSIVNDTGQINANDVDDIQVNCSDDTFFVGGNVTGLQPGFSLVLKNNNQDDLSINISGSFVFATPLLDLVDYDVSMQIYPANTSRDCVLTRNSGIITGDDIDDVQITCGGLPDLIFKNGFEQ